MRTIYNYKIELVSSLANMGQEGDFDKSLVKAKEAARRKSERLRELYSRDPEVFAEILNRLGFFQFLENQEDIVKHNEALKLMVDIGMVDERKINGIVDMLLKGAETPQEYR